MLCKSFATIGERVGTIFTNKQEERAREKVKNIIYVVMKYVKHYKENINLTGMKELLRLCGLDKRVLVQESRFELVLIMNSLDRLSEALDHKRVLQVFQHLVLTSYEDPVIVYYCTEVINKLVATTSPELLINLWCFAPLIESMLQKLKEYTIEKAPHPLLEAIAVFSPSIAYPCE
ncbi:MAG: hypothetical protein P4M11_12460 [Candidatus Pacebacteria bacterium]|nr:hypothetical protein [Candidatus Paceibacterota bacterium]